MLPSWRLALNALAGRPGRTTLIIAAVALAASLVVAVSCAIGSAQGTIEQTIARLLGATDARIVHQFDGRFDESILEQARQWPGVKKATGQLETSITLVHKDKRRDPETNELLRTTPQATGVNLDRDPTFRPINIVKGRRPQNENELLVDSIFAEQMRADLNDELVVQRFGPPIELRLVGIYERETLGILQRPQVRLARSTLAEASNHQGELSNVSLILDEDVEVKAFCERHQHELPDSLDLQPAERARSGFDQRVQASQFGLIVASMLAFLAAAFIIVTALTTSVIEKQREMAMMRCVGAARTHLFAGQLLVGATVGIVGALVGVPLGIGLAAILVWWFGEMINAGFVVHSLGVWLGSIGSIAAGLLASIYPAWLSSSVPPMVALRRQARPVRKRSFVYTAIVAVVCLSAQIALLVLPNDPNVRFYAYAWAGMPLLYVGYFFTAVLVLLGLTMVLHRPLSALLRLPAGMLGRSVLTTPFRNGFTAGALMVGIGVLVSTWSNTTSLINDWFRSIQFADAFVYRTTGIGEADRQAVAELDFVTSTCPVGYLSLPVVDGEALGVRGLTPPNVICMGFEPECFFDINNVKWVQGNPETGIARLKEGDAIIVAERFYTARGVTIGDTITLGSPRVQKTFEVVGVVTSPGLSLITQLFGIGSAYREYAIGAVFTDYDTMVRTFDMSDTQFLQLDLRDAISDEQAADRIKEAAPAVLFASGRWIIAFIENLFRAVLAIQSTVAFCALVLAALGAGNVLAANIHGRRFEYGVLRSVGARRGVLARLIFCEAALFAVAGAITGTALGLHAAWAGAFFYRELVGIPIGVVVPWLPTGSGWLVLISLSLGAALPGVLYLVRRTPSALLAAGRND